MLGKTPLPLVSLMAYALLVLCGCNSSHSSRATRPDYDVNKLLETKWCVLQWGAVLVRFDPGRAGEAASLLKLALKCDATDVFEGNIEEGKLSVFLYDSLTESQQLDGTPRLTVHYNFLMRFILVRDGETQAEYFFRPDAETLSKLRVIFDRLDKKYNRTP